jgi:hypothetical protein
MNEEQRIKLVEEELKILKNEVKTILLDIREQYLNIQNPFNFNMVANTPPAGANPDQRDKEAENPAVDLNMPKDEALPSPSADFTPAELSFGKAFTDLSTKTETEKPGLAGLAAFAGDAPGMGPSAGAGMAPEEGFADKPEEEEQAPRARNTRSKKKAAAPVEPEPDEDGGSEDNESREDLLNTKPVAPRNGKKRSNLLMSGTRADLVIIAGLTQWVDQATGKLGKDRTEALVEMSTAMGRIPDNIKDVLIRMVRISRYESTNTQSPTATDYLATLAQLESLMGGEQIQDNALLSILSMMKESNRG